MAKLRNDNIASQKWIESRTQGIKIKERSVTKFNEYWPDQLGAYPWQWLRRRGRAGSWCCPAGTDQPSQPFLNYKHKHIQIQEQVNGARGAQQADGHIGQA